MPRNLIATYLLITLMVASLCQAQGTVTQLADLNTGLNRVTRGSMQGDPSVFFDNKTLLVLRTPQLGAELWITDGTPQNTRLFADICPGQCSGNPAQFYIEGSNLFFSADDGRFGTELWRLAAGSSAPVLVSDINPGAKGSNPAEFKRINFRVGAIVISRTFFAATRDQDGRELWRLINGGATNPGPSAALELDIANGAASSSPIDVNILNTAQVGVIARTPNSGRELHALEYTSTTAAPTGSTVFAAFATSVTRNARELLTLGSNTYVILDDNNTPQDELWVTQGTPATTLKLRTAGIIENLTFNASLFRMFFVSGSGSIKNIAVTDGSLAGTTILSTSIVNPTNVVTAGNRLLFMASTPATGRELFSSDGTAAGTGLLKEFVSGATGISANVVSAANLLSSSAMFGFNDQLWLSDNTAAGTIEISGAAINGAVAIQSITPTRALEAIVGVFPISGDNSSEPFLTRGTAASTVSLGNIRTDVGDSTVIPIAEFSQRIMFRAEISSEPNNIFFSLPRSGALPLERLPNLADRTGGAHFGKLWFNAFDFIQTDATIAGTTSIASVRSPRVSDAACVQTRNGLRYFLGQSPANSLDVEVYRSDGTAAGTVPVTDVSTATREGLDSFCVDQLRTIAQMGSDIYFVGGAANTGQELQKLDANEQTTLVADIRAGAEFAFIRDIVALDDRLIFAANDGIFGNELWVSRGTAQSTLRLTDLNPGSASTTISALTRVGNQVYFTATAPNTGSEVYVTDGTSAGTRIVLDLFAGVGSSFGDNLTPMLAKGNNNNLIFRATGSTCRLFETDGSALGTRCLYDTIQHSFGPVSQFLVTQSGAVVFAATKDGSGDGEEIRAIFDRQVLNLSGGDVAPGSLGSAPARLLSAGGSVYFQANDGATGAELYKLDLPNFDVLLRNGFE